ncbi:sunset domain-containing protein [Neorhizobium galegae]|uniref:sunset domain-containing protein n=1 Tax=Neorhizobium galegae TaxID=399 RepID=UPI000589FC7D|nr:hypothetical protein [Neorhizobium galegae]
MSKFPLLVVAASHAAFTTTGGYAIAPREWYDPACNIKGNVSTNSRERIFHVPGQLDYNATIISRQYGERWFCSEDEARSAGWRKATR